MNKLNDLIKSQTNSIKAKDIDIQRLNKRIQRLEKMVEVNKNIDGMGKQARINKPSRTDVIRESDEIMEETLGYGESMYTNQIEAQVNKDLINN